MSLKRRRGKVLLLLGLLFAFLALVWIATPLWFPWMLRPVVGKLGVTYTGYRHLGYRHFAVEQVTYRDQSVQVKASRIEALVPSAWLWRLVFGQPSDISPFARIQDWEVTPLAATNAVTSPPAGGPPAASKLPQTLETVARWIPLAQLSNGTVRLPPVINAPDLIWSKGSVQGTILFGTNSFKIAARPASRAVFQGDVSSEPLHLSSRIYAGLEQPGVALTNTLSWWSNRIEMEAQFGPSGSYPRQAMLVARKFTLPSQVLGLPYYDQISGTLSARWQTNAFVLDTEAQVTPSNSANPFPPLELKLRMRGDTNSAIVQSAMLSSPWLKAELSRELEVHFQGPLLRQPAFLKVAADLGAQPWLQAQGKLEGEADLYPSEGKIPGASFRLSGSGLKYDSYQSRSLLVEGRLAWPRVEISKAAIVLEDDSKVDLRGKIDLQTKVVSDGHVAMQGPWPARFLPAGYSCQSMRAEAAFTGPLSALQHKGDLFVTNFITPQFEPLTFETHWNGTQTNFQRIEMSARAGASSLDFAGGLLLTNDEAHLDLASFELRTNNQPILSLRSPCSINTKISSTSQATPVTVSPMMLEGPAGRIEISAGVSWPAQGAFRAKIEGISSTLLDGFLKSKPPELHLAHLEAVGNWTNGPLDFKLSLAAHANLPVTKGQALPLGLRLEASASETGITITNLMLSSQTSLVFSAHGNVPLRLNPSTAKELVHIDKDQTLRFAAFTGPDAFFWQELTNYTRLYARNPQANLQVSGTWDQPVGNLNIRAEEIRLPWAKTNIPSLKNLELIVELDRDKARLKSGQFLVQGQRIALEAELPLASEFWSELTHGQVPDWRTATARVQVEDAELAAFGPLFPNLLAPEGELNMDVMLRQGGHLDGEIRLEHARTRPLANTGPVRDIELVIRFRDRVIELSQATAKISGATVTLNGQLDLTGNKWLQGEIPPFSFSLSGNSVPLARQPEYILRSDLLLGIVKTNGAPPLISGTATLHDSFFLSDLRSLIPGKIAKPSVRPPYFSIDDPLVADWRLAVDVQGTRFMRLRSPVFAGTISTGLKIQGTLQDPIALGDVRLDSGLVRFPFASLEVQQGVVNLTSQDPYHPRLLVRAASKQFGYDIRMDVSGPVDAPLIQFNSTPPLSSEQILLMVSAGEMPQGTYNLTAQQRAQTVALFVGRDLLSKLGIGGGESEPRLNVRSGEEISEQGRSTYRVEYKLTERWSLTGEYDRFGDFNAGFKWRVYSR